MPEDQSASHITFLGDDSMVTMATMRILASTICIILFSVVSSCPPECQSCDNGRFACVSAGLQQPPDIIPDDTLVIDLSQNDIRALEGLPSAPNAQSLRLPANKLEKLEASVLSVVPSLMSLDLSQNSITLIDDKAFDGLIDLRTVSLTGNKLTSIGQVFKDTPQLTSVRLGNNEITEIGEDAFKDNTMVKMLDLSNNNVKKIHKDAFSNLDMLRYLILSNNPITTLPELSFTSTMLLLADFSNCQLQSVPRTMPSSLKDFRLGNNRIKEILVDDFQNMTEVTLITLNDNMIENVAHRAFGSLENLQELWLSRNQLVYIPRGLPASLEKLYIDNNHVVELAPTLFQANANLKYLSLEANKVMKIHQDSLKDVTQLETLNLQGNEVSLIDVGTFTHLPELKDLVLSNNPVQVFENGAFADLTSLTELSLSHIDHTVTGPEKILDENILVAMPIVESIDLTSSPFLTEKLLEILSESESFTSSVKTLILQYNELTTLPEIIKTAFPNIETIILDGNPWKCDKKLAWLRDWIKSSSVTFHRFEEPTCNQPASLQGRLLSTVEDSELVEEVQQPSEPVNTPVEQTNPVETSPDSQVAENQDTKVENPTSQGTSPNRPSYGVQVVVKAPQSTRKQKTKLQRQQEKAAKKAEKERRKKERQERRKKNKGKKRRNKDRRKRRIEKRRGMRCRVDENGLKVCKLRKRCKVLDDGSVRCRKRGGKKQVRKPNNVN